MDLLQTVRKEGSRGGVNFSWDDVKNSQHRENYLGHSLMAPVGRWQKNKDLSWYARAEDAELTPEQRAEREQERKREEMRKIKEAEEDAMLKAVGLPVPDRTNANHEPLGLGKDEQRKMNQALKEALSDDGDTQGGKGVGRQSHGGEERDGGRELARGSRPRDDRSRSRERKRRRVRDQDERGNKTNRRSRSRSRDRERRHRHRRRHESSRSRSRSGDRRRKSRSRDRKRHDDSERRDRHRDRDDRSRSRERHHRRRQRSRSRSRSPYERRRHRDDR